MALPAPAFPMIERLVAESAHRQDEIIGWFPSEPEQAAAAFNLAVEQGTIIRISGENDADASARWAVTNDQARRAADEAAQAE